MTYYYLIQGHTQQQACADNSDEDVTGGIDGGDLTGDLSGNNTPRAAVCLHGVVETATQDICG